MTANNVTRMLDAKKVAYQVFEFSPEKRSAQETAALLGVSPEIVFKTIVVLREKPKKPLLAVIPGNHEVNLKLLASVVGEKKVRLPTQREAEEITGLQAGGISPLALINKGFSVVLDSSAENFEAVHISGGQRGLNIRLPVKALVSLTNALTGSISQPADTTFDD